VVLDAPQTPEAGRGRLPPQCRKRRQLRRWRQAAHERIVNERLAHRPKLHGQEAKQWQHCRQRGLLEADIEGIIDSLGHHISVLTTHRSPTSERFDDSIGNTTQPSCHCAPYPLRKFTTRPIHHYTTLRPPLFPLTTSSLALPCANHA